MIDIYTACFDYAVPCKIIPDNKPSSLKSILQTTWFLEKKMTTQPPDFYYLNMCTVTI